MARGLSDVPQALRLWQVWVGGLGDMASFQRPLADSGPQALPASGQRETRPPLTRGHVSVQPEGDLLGARGRLVSLQREERDPGCVCGHTAAA